MSRNIVWWAFIIINIPLLPVNSDGHHVHQGGGHVAIEEEGEDSAQGGAQGPLLVNISETDIYFFVTPCMTRIYLTPIFTDLYLEAVRGRLIALKRRSETAKLITKAVVA